MFRKNLYSILSLIIGVLVCNGVIAQVSMSTMADMNFGAIMFTQNHSGVLQLGTNGNVTVIGYGLEHSGMTSAGEININSEDAGTAEMRCSTEGNLSFLGATEDLPLRKVEVSTNTSKPFGSADACKGINFHQPTLLLDMAGSSNTKLFIGAELDLSNSKLQHSGEYSTIQGGSPISIDIVFQ